MGSISSTAQEILFFKAKGNESDRSVKTGTHDLTCNIQQNGERAGIVVRTGRTDDRVVVRRKNKRGTRTPAPMGHRGDQVLVDSTPCLKPVRVRLKPEPCKLRPEIVRRVLKRTGGGIRMPLPNHLLKMRDEAIGVG